MGPNAALGLILGILVLFVIFLIFRDFVCWYFKINERTKLLTEIRDLLKQKEKEEKNQDA